MASSFRLNSQSYQGRYMYLTCEQQEKNVVTNSSPVKWTLTVTGGSAGYYTTGPTTVKINGQIVYYKEQVLWNKYIFPAAKGSVSGTINIPHDELGNAVVEVSIHTNIYTGVLQTKTGTWELDSIARYANITNAPDFTDEVNPKITYANYAGDKVDKLQAAISTDGKTALVPYRDISVSGTTYTFALTNAERDALRTASSKSNSLTVTYLLKTTIGDVEGVTTAIATMKIVNAQPVVDPEITDTNAVSAGVTGDSSVLVALHSTARVTLNAVAQKKATIVSRKVEQGKTVLSGDGTFLVSSADPIRITVTDSRGNTTSLTAPNEVVPYIDPTCMIEHTLPDANGEMLLSVIGNAYNGLIGKTQNTLTVQYRHRVGYGEYGEWVTISNLTQDGNDYAASVLVTGLDYKSRHTFQARVTDAIHADGVMSTEQTFIAEPTFDWSESDFNFNVPVTMSGHQIKELAPPTDEGDAIPFGYKDPQYLAVAGGTMSGPIAMDGNRITGLPEPANDSDVATKKTVANALSAFAHIEIKKLWENASPASTFAAQTISLDLSGYDMVEIVFVRGANGPNNTISWKMDKGFDGYPFHMSHLNESSNTTTLTRHTVVTDTGVEFGDGIYKFTSSTTNGTENTAMIPYKIYGVKGVSE